MNFTLDYKPIGKHRARQILREHAFYVSRSGNNNHYLCQDGKPIAGPFKHLADLRQVRVELIARVIQQMAKEALQVAPQAENGEEAPITIPPAPYTVHNNGVVRVEGIEVALGLVPDAAVYRFFEGYHPALAKKGAAK